MTLTIKRIYSFPHNNAYSLLYAECLFLSVFILIILYPFRANISIKKITGLIKKHESIDKIMLAKEILYDRYWELM
jgi:hypothetical protein